MVIADIYAMREQSGDAALYFDPVKPEQIAAAMETLWTDDQAVAKLKQAGLEQRKKYQFTAFTQNLGRILLP